MSAEMIQNLEAAAGMLFQGMVGIFIRTANFRLNSEDSNAVFVED